jgi:hypothetical protein
MEGGRKEIWDVGGRNGIKHCKGGGYVRLQKKGSVNLGDRVEGR